MDKVFRAIGRFFKKIWEWIKETAWVQPLLIVTIIFGIIFSINPIVNAIKSAVNADSTGTFYTDHWCEKKMNLFFKNIDCQAPSYYNSTPVINDNSGYSMVIIYNSSSYDMEADVKSFYNSSTVNALSTQCKLYVVNLANDENQYSYYDDYKGEYVNTRKEAQYSNYLLDRIVEVYNGEKQIGEDSDGNPLYWKEYNKPFMEQYHYQIFYPDFTKDDNYETTTGGTSDLHLPAAIKFYNNDILDFRFATGSSFTNYKTDSNNIQILTDLWIGADFGNHKALTK